MGFALTWKEVYKGGFISTSFHIVDIIIAMYNFHFIMWHSIAILRSSCTHLSRWPQWHRSNDIQMALFIPSLPISKSLNELISILLWKNTVPCPIFPESEQTDRLDFCWDEQRTNSIITNVISREVLRKSLYYIWGSIWGIWIYLRMTGFPCQVEADSCCK